MDQKKADLIDAIMDVVNSASKAANAWGDYNGASTPGLEWDHLSMSLDELAATLVKLAKATNSGSSSAPA